MNPDFLGFLTSVPWTIHPDFSIRVNIYPKGNLFIFIVVNRVKVLKEGLSKYEVFIVKLIEFVLCYGELTFVWGLEKILAWLDFKDSFPSCLVATRD